ncbi:MAG: Peptide methionine sulfoxide reductase MsrA [Alphaproteobacteria bacterium MarineAlpha5_Bin11]|nr:peptide-methionine (S)-S-oxide reductase [Pelagibacteraceae bacterium]PPR44053.1 MAG: Peptide methionine sulfoxide reductase MsrA [Alphaproteobacteria bacterium MarineAlpha5_Bin11]PPR51982.1 MAG: Peptide methionine sulfoxide reductase MsrA [Alphaproteobacteria bacterium MarineAlpha5_Bin10]|tara:strand:+ start:1415 stop:1876 length:462 start_codon:yes stop_codon:yes gene_type:complete
MTSNKAIFAAGCFWGVEEIFSKLNGVLSTEVGYSGGTKESPSYEEVCTGRTGHAEAVLVNFDSNTTSYELLLEEFWKCHDPTTLNRQGLDIGPQYRSAIFYFDEYQRDSAINSMQKISGDFDSKIVTEVKEFSNFFPAEEYHQKYIQKKVKFF